MSTASSVMSTMSISINGEEVVLETALDKTFSDLQTALNGLHCNTRECCMILDQDNDFETMVGKGDDVNNGIDEMMLLFKDLKSIIKQVMLKPDGQEEKDWLKQHRETQKLMKATKMMAIKE
jgi:hypothetical protein